MMNTANNKNPLVILSGPTAVGKSELSIKLAKAIDGEIISADSMQVYCGMDIGTAKITKEEMGDIPHYLIDVLDPRDEFNIYTFKEMASKAAKEIQDKGKIPILVGGTGFYIQSILYDIDFTLAEDLSDYRKELSLIAQNKGNEYLHRMLEEADPVSANKIHANDTKRVIRALEYYKQTGECISSHNEEEGAKESPYNYCYFVLTDDRKVIYDRINIRVDKMIEKGLVEEVMALKNQGLNCDYVSMKGLGYKEILDYLDGRITLDEAIYIIKRDSRHFAKRQLTWFKRERDVIWLDKTTMSDEEILRKMIIELTNSQITEERQ